MPYLSEPYKLENEGYSIGSKGFVDQVLVEGSVVTFRNNRDYADLVCTCAPGRIHAPTDLAYCRHMEVAIDESMDVYAGEEVYPLPYHVEVPLLRHPGVALNIELIAAPQDGWFDCWVMGKGTDHDALDLPIGRISSGDGRRVIRDLFFDWLDDAIMAGAWLCQSGFHVGEHPAVGNLLDNKTDPALADVVDMLLYKGWCRECQRDVVEAFDGRNEPPIRIRSPKDEI